MDREGRRVIGSGALRLAAFADPDEASSMSLLSAILAATARRADIELVAIVDAAFLPPSSSPLRIPTALARLAARRLFNLNTAAQPAVPSLAASCAVLARRRRVPLLAPRERGVNDSGFVEQLRALKPDVTMNLKVGQIFRAPLLAACGTPVNYHDGLLPLYQGVAATSWSIYERAARSGFSFHLMTAQVDRGPILAQGAIELGPGAALWPTLRAKTRLACAQVGGVLERFAAGAVSPREQTAEGSSFSRADLRAIRTVEEPGALSLAELELRLRAFEALELTIAGQRVNTTALRRVRHRPRGRRLAFVSADGVWLEPSRIAHLPPAVSRARSLLRAA